MAIVRDDVDEHGVIPFQFDETQIQLLDNTVPGGLRTIETRPDWLATISAGFKKKNDRGQEYPAVERGGIIHIPNAEDEARAPGLVAALKQDPKHLTIAVCSDNPYEVVTQRWVHYSTTTCDIFGDATKITHVTASPRAGEKKASVKFDTHYVGTQEYADLVKQCKAETSLFFCLVEWSSDGMPHMVWHDGMKPYRLRFTSRNSAVSVLGQLIQQRKFFRSLIGIPWELSLDYRDVVGPDPEKGFARHNVPVWGIKIVRPGGIKIDPAFMQRVIQHAASDAQVLRALPPPSYTVEHALLEAPDVDMDDGEMEEAVAKSLANPAPPADAKYWRSSWHAAVKNDPLLSSDDGRHAFVQRFTQTRWPNEQPKWTNSLEGFLASATEADANALFAKLDEVMTALAMKRNSRQVPNTTTTTVEPEQAKEPEPEKEPDPPAAAAPAPEPEQQQTDPGDQYQNPEPWDLPLEEAAALAENTEEGSFTETPAAAADSSAVADDASSMMDEAFSPETPPTEAPGASDEKTDDRPAKVKLATAAQKKMIEQLASPARMASINLDTITFDDAGPLIEDLRSR